MKSSVIIPVYNASRSIEKTVNSVLLQKKIGEIILVEDGSKDESLAVCEKLSKNYSNIGVLRHPGGGNKGVSATRNLGVKNVKYELIAFLDADDEWDSDFIEKISFLIENFPEAGLYATGFRLREEGNFRYPNYKSMEIPEGGHGILNNFLVLMQEFTPFCSSSVVVRKKDLLEVGGFPEGVTHGEDLDTWLRMFFKTPFAYMNSAAATYNIKLPGSAMQEWEPEEEFVPVITAEQILQSDSCPNAYLGDLQDFISHQQLDMARRLVYSGKNQRAIDYLRQIPSTSKFKHKRNIWWSFAYLPPQLVKSILYLKDWIKNAFGLHVLTKTKKVAAENG